MLLFLYKLTLAGKITPRVGASTNQRRERCTRLQQPFAIPRRRNGTYSRTPREAKSGINGDRIAIMPTGMRARSTPNEVQRSSIGRDRGRAPAKELTARE